MPSNRDEWVEVGSPQWRKLLEQRHRKPRWQRWAGVVAVLGLVWHAVYLEHREIERRALVMVKLGEITALTELAAERAGNARE